MWRRVIVADPTLTPSFPTLLQRFFVEHLAQHRAVSPRTIAAYRDTFRLLLDFVEGHIGKSPTTITLVDLDAKLILSFLDHLEKDRNNGARSRNARLAALRSFLKYAVHHDLAAIEVIERALAIPMKKFDRPMLGFLSRQEMQAIVDAPDPESWVGQRDRAFFSVLYNTGARVSEAIGLRVRDIADGSAVHLMGKGRKERSVPLWRSTATLVRNWKRQLDDVSAENFLFPSQRGGKLTRSNVTQRLALAVAIATTRCPQLVGRAVSPHTIRHTSAMHLLQSGVDITVIALWLGHESPATMHMYLEADLSTKERALSRLQPLGTKIARYRPPDQLRRFLQSL
jgi:integrase/recombinase XerD